MLPASRSCMLPHESGAGTPGRCQRHLQIGSMSSILAYKGNGMDHRLYCMHANTQCSQSRGTQQRQILNKFGSGTALCRSWTRPTAIIIKQALADGQQTISAHPSNPQLREILTSRFRLELAGNSNMLWPGVLSFFWSSAMQAQKYNTMYRTILEKEWLASTQSPEHQYCRNASA